MLDNYWFVVVLLCFIGCERFCKMKNRGYFFVQVVWFGVQEGFNSRLLETLKIVCIVFLSLSFSVDVHFVFLPLVFVFVVLAFYLYLQNKR